MSAVRRRCRCSCRSGVLLRRRRRSSRSGLSLQCTLAFLRVSDALSCSWSFQPGLHRLLLLPRSGVLVVQLGRQVKGAVALLRGGRRRDIAAGCSEFLVGGSFDGGGRRLLRQRLARALEQVWARARSLREVDGVLRDGLLVIEVVPERLRRALLRAGPCASALVSRLLRDGGSDRAFARRGGAWLVRGGWITYGCK